MLIPVKKIRRTRILLTTDKERVTSFSLIVKESEDLDIDLQLVLVKMDILGAYRVWKISEIIVFKLLFRIKIWSVAMFSVARGI